jgi:hypothetical protein
VADGFGSRYLNAYWETPACSHSWERRWAVLELQMPVTRKAPHRIVGCFPIMRLFRSVVGVRGIRSMWRHRTARPFTPTVILANGGMGR